MLPTINTSLSFAKWGMKWLIVVMFTRLYPLKFIDSLHVNALPPQIYEAVVWQEGTDWQVIVGSAFQLCSPVLLHFICSGFTFTHKREVSSMPSPSPLLNPWPDYVAQLPELQWQVEKNTCRSRQQISLICFVFDWFLLLFGNATAHKVGISLESFEICLSSVVFAWSCRPTCPRSLNTVGRKKKK